MKKVTTIIVFKSIATIYNNKQSTFNQPSPSTTMSSIYNVLDDLVRMLIRAFYTDEYIIVIDAVLRQKKRVKEDEIANQINIPFKYCRKILMDLRGDSILKSQEVKEEGKGPGDRAITTQLWYLDYSHIIDIIKYKMYMVRKMMEAEKTQKFDLQYKCVACAKLFSAYDIPQLLTPEGDLCCDRCDGKLTEEKSSADFFSNQTKQNADMLGQLKKLVEQLKKTEGQQIPLFARDMAQGNMDTGPSHVINTSSSTGPAKQGAFGPNEAAGGNKGWIDPSSSSVEVLVDIYDSDNVDTGHIISSNAKKETKKPTHPVPPWLLPKSLEPSPNSTNGGALGNASKNAKIEMPLSFAYSSTKSQAIDKTYFDDYVTKHYKDEADDEVSKKQRINSPNHPSSNNSNSNTTALSTPTSSSSSSSTTTSAQQQPQPLQSTCKVTVIAAGKSVNLLEVTEEDQEIMSSQEYEDYNMALYNFVASSQESK
ncbi:transcription factor IIE [Cavenderia fasciculata]|uniref:Transcription factor IIE n=1 Tax=Cavenderia fasciculata TaxID=261658 RepID=F4QBS3_CACFS|nr:transcription factor IIE [Cavenderia fasciculata]EGG14661.1 transcription factor IIE [Cavenderia fasciculata]|eukprot:XP_004351169.1 transcription factor IIE [Cavenderia fasciculata]